MVSRITMKTKLKEPADFVSDRKVPTCDHVAILTNDSVRLEGFYKRNWGFKKEKEEVLPKSIGKLVLGIDSDCRFLRLVSPAMKIEIFQPCSSKLKSRPRNITGYSHWGLKVGDKEKFCRSLRRRKVKVTLVQRESHTVYFAEDPDGNKIEIRD
jgi:catechol 2,3-dioxygenase-like lactoylglutathione lyase family enzyme